MAAFDLVDTTRQYLAVIVIGGSTLRNQGQGTTRRVQDYLLTSVDLANLATKSEDGFRDWLDRHTGRLLGTIKGEHEPWGTARKALNMFVRACICNHHLRGAFGLGHLDAIAEMPLDSLSANALRDLPDGQSLPRWAGLRHLKPSESGQFQRFAAEHSARIGAPGRIYLDFELWVENRPQ